MAEDTRICALPECGREFTPRKSHQKFCHPSHGQRLSNSRRYVGTVKPPVYAEPRPPDPDLGDDELVRMAEERGYIIHRPAPPTEPVVVDTSRIRGKRVKLGVLSDIHAGSKFGQPHYTRQHAKMMRREGCTAILVPGDVTDGSSKMHPGFEYETWAQGFDAQVEAALASLPEVGIPYYVIAGNHDASHFKAAGADIVKAVCDRRDDLNYLGPEISHRNFQGSVGYLEVGDILIQMCHPHMGSTRTRSYRLETWIENLAPPRPKLVVMGNFHKPVQGIFRGTWGVMVPGMQAVSTWMASKGIESVVGSTILEFGTQTKGLAPEVGLRWIVEWEPRSGDYPT